MEFFINRCKAPKAFIKGKAKVAVKSDHIFNFRELMNSGRKKNIKAVTGFSIHEKQKEISEKIANSNSAKKAN